MGYKDRCLSCYGSGKLWQYDSAKDLVECQCRKCGGSGKQKPYRRTITITEGDSLGWNTMESSPKYHDDGCCASCNTKLSGRRRTFCSDDCKRGYLWRVWKGAHWQKRAIAHRDGSACAACGEVHESPIRPGGKPYPEYSELQLDHKKALYLGGTEQPENCQLLCEECHKKKTKRERSNLPRDAAKEA